MDVEREVNVGERLFLYRDATGWSQAEVAKRAGISRTSVVLTETGETRPRLPTLRRLARAFGVSVEEFLSNREPNPRPLVEAAELVERLRDLPSGERKLILRGLHEDWTSDPETDARAMERAIDFERETGARAEDIRRALVELEPLQAKRLEIEARHWQRLVFEAVARGDLSPAEAMRKAEAFSRAA